MRKKIRAFAGPLIEELEKHGVNDATISWGNHPQLVFTWQGQQRIFAFSGSTSDHRAALNARSDLRKMLHQ
jgi:hypothetical protein